jgi:hypothetical protein
MILLPNQFVGVFGMIVWKGFANPEKNACEFGTSPI